ncbi:uncharacterized protein LOC131243411 isoform X1 [Magnolia sinica]|uniref:uncharacterized protein LOC131243411 isoform X1 n=1 Tax=Magnolia sinica TaxID=86752 RepID=UPI00265A60A5|nr:uncharacterized protein LOC131243411 isoform X1 [Magnolia sinica]
MSLSTASYLARRASQKERVRILYRRALKDTLNWAVHRHLFYEDASNLRERFEANKHVFPGLLAAASLLETHHHLRGLRSSTTMVEKTTTETSNMLVSLLIKMRVRIQDVVLLLLPFVSIRICKYNYLNF